MDREGQHLERELPRQASFLQLQEHTYPERTTHDTLAPTYISAT